MLPILLLEDDQSLGYILSEYLDMHDIPVLWIKTAEEAIELIDDHSFSLALLDIMLPGINGFEFAKILKSRIPNLPFLFISAKSLKIDQLKGYKLGAVDYLTKPIDEELLVAKIKVLTGSRQSNAILESVCQIGKYSFAPNEQTLSISQESIKLTNRETELLTLLYSHRNKLMPRKLALQQIWGSADEFSRKSMDVPVMPKS